MSKNYNNDLHMPLVEAMLNYKNENVYPLHTPGHKGGRGMETSLKKLLGESVLVDVSLMSELDDIHEPETYIKEAQALAAQAYKSDACFWAVNGTSQAIHAMLMLASSPGDKVLIPRNAHRSVAGGLILGGLKAVYIEPEYNEEFGILTQVTPQIIEQALDDHPDIKAVLITSPNYYGIAADTKKIAELCHARKKILLVDEAHGPHLGFSKALPPSAMECDADACAQSTHKIVGAMTQCSMLQVKQERLDIERARDVMSVLTTTSPNYLLMMSLDAARAQLQAHGEEMCEHAINAAQSLRALLKEFTGIKVLEAADVPQFFLDETKVTVHVSSWGYTGIEVGDALREAGVAVELVDPENILFLVSYADDNSDFTNAMTRIKAVFECLEQYKESAREKHTIGKPPLTQSKLSLREVFYGEKEKICFDQASGRVAAEQISFYPPGIPIILPGEIISDAIISYCQKMKRLGLPVSGPADSSLKTIRVVK
ncbi:MAG: aminotransferase class I/II-fold pyridoxal phosphate-dependent enzyme [Phascolarctobacterium sp.]|nr:aminotransferase class I/II-fold pyridoxal phosphate-dependent enzyme [Phascolarctobacterium sp.]